MGERRGVYISRGPHADAAVADEASSRAHEARSKAYHDLACRV